MPNRIEVHSIREVERPGSYSWFEVQGTVDGERWQHLMPVWMLDAHVAEWDLDDDDPQDVLDMCLLLPFESDAPAPFAEGAEKDRRREEKRQRMRQARAAGKLTYAPQARGAGHVAQVALDSHGRHSEIRDRVRADTLAQAQRETERSRRMATPASVLQHFAPPPLAPDAPHRVLAERQKEQS